MSDERQASNGQWIKCGACRNGIVSVYSAREFEGPGECLRCTAGVIWQYPSGALAKYPGGPFVGSLSSPLAPTQEGE